MNGAYFNGLDANGQQSALSNIPGSVTTDYILFSLNVASGTSADINYGWNFGCVLARDGKVTPEVGNILAPIVQAGVSKGTCQRVWITIGAAVWENPPPEHPEYRQMTETFTNIQTILNTGGTLQATLLANFGALAQAFKNIPGVKSVGFDMDYEESYTALASVVANVSLAVYNKLQCPITFCPFQQLENGQQSPWITALQQVYAMLKTQPVVGFNLQTYAGGSNNNPTQWTAAIKNAKNTGVGDPAAFIWPIVSCDPDATPVTYPEQVAGKLQDWSPKGASLWATQSLPPPLPPPTQLSVYSAAIARGIA